MAELAGRRGEARTGAFNEMEDGDALEEGWRREYNRGRRVVTGISWTFIWWICDEAWESSNPIHFFVLKRHAELVFELLCYKRIRKHPADSQIYVASHR